jgi:arsenate reductase
MHVFNEGGFVRISGPADRALSADTGAGDDRDMAKAKAVTIYGIKNCDTMKKARAWLDGHGVAYEFHDYKAAGIDRGRLEGWVREVGWEILLNRAGTTFRGLPEKDKEGLTEKRAVALMLAQPSMIKRPVLDVGGRLLVGFKPEIYEKAFGSKG